MSLPNAAAMERVLFEALDPEPDSELIDRPDWAQIRTSSSQDRSHNRILWARIDESDVDATVADVLDDHRRRGATFWWIVGPSSRPADLGARLEAAGMQSLGETWGMALEVPTEPPRWSMAELTVERVTADNATLAAETNAEAWQVGDPAVGDRIRRALLRKVPDPRFPMWLARFAGAPVAVCNLRLLEACGYLQGCAVRSAYRRRGIYGSLVRFRLGVLAEAGLPTAVIWANADSSGLACAKLGFQRICDAGFYEWRPRSRR